jgi:hypothetical protein
VSDQPQQPRRTQPAPPPGWVPPPPPAKPPSWDPPPGAYVQPPPAGKSRAWVTWLIALATFGAGLIVGSASGDSGDEPGSQTAAPSRPATTAATRPETTQPPLATIAEPTGKDFRLGIKILEKSCFGSAGCNITYRIEVAYDGPTLDPDRTYEVIYEVRGGDDGPKINTPDCGRRPVQCRQ